jgi:hypothetical protein
LIGSILCIFLGGLLLPLALHAQDAIRVQRDRDKTVYTIGSNPPTKQEDQEDKAWEMLKNMGIIVDRRKGQSLQNPPAQPAPVK